MNDDLHNIDSELETYSSSTEVGSCKVLIKAIIKKQDSDKQVSKNFIKQTRGKIEKTT